MFDAFNRCADPAQLALHAGHFDPAVEFYHDTGGVTWTREEMLANTAKYACGHYTRELVAGSLQADSNKSSDYQLIATITERRTGLVIARAVSRVKADEIDATPTVFLGNGKRLVGATPPEIFVAELDASVKR